MRYSKEIEAQAKELEAEGKTLDYICSVTNIPKKVIISWCPSLRPHEDVIKWSVKQRFHYDFPDYEAVISSAFSKYIKEGISDKEWDNLNKVISNVLFEEAIKVFQNAISDPPDFTDTNKLSDISFLDYLKAFWNYDTSPYFKGKSISREYALQCLYAVRYWSMFRNKLLRDMTSSDLTILKEKLEQRNLSEHRIKFIIQVGRLPLKFAFENGLTINRAFDFKLKKPEKSKCKVLNFEEAIELFSKDWNDKEAMLANFLAFICHLKQNELRGLKIKDLTTDTIYINNAYLRNNTLVPLKNPKAVKVSEVIITIIKGYVIENKFYDKEDYVFTKRKGIPADPRTWTTSLKEVAKSMDYDYESIDFTMWSRL